MACAKYLYSMSMHMCGALQIHIHVDQSLFFKNRETRVIIPQQIFRMYGIFIFDL